MGVDETELDIYNLVASVLLFYIIHGYLSLVSGINTMLSIKLFQNTY